MYDPMLLVIGGAFMFISMLVSNRLKSKFQYYSNMPTTSGLSGAEIAVKMNR